MFLFPGKPPNLGPGEGDHEGVALGLDLVAVVRLQQPAHGAVVQRERGLHHVGVVFPEPCRALNIGEDQRDGAGGSLRHKQTLSRLKRRAWAYSLGNAHHG